MVAVSDHGPQDAGAAHSESPRLRSVPTDSSARTDDEFCAFYRDFVPKLVGFLIVQGARLTEAVDVVQETMTRAYEHWTTIDKPAAWARTVASRELVRRRASLMEDSVPEINEGTLLLSSSVNVADWEDGHEILRLLSILPARQRQVLAWTFDGYSPVEIANELRITPEAVRASLFKARRTLAEHIDLRKDTP